MAWVRAARITAHHLPRLPAFNGPRGEPSMPEPSAAASSLFVMSPCCLSLPRADRRYDLAVVVKSVGLINLSEHVKHPDGQRGRHEGNVGTIRRRHVEQMEEPVRPKTRIPCRAGRHQMHMNGAPAATSPKLGRDYGRAPVPISGKLGLERFSGRS